MLDSMQVSREDVITLAERAIYKTEDGGSPVSLKLRNQLMRVAREADKLCLGWWSDEHECGCLVGTLRNRQGLSVYGSEGAEHQVALEFAQVAVELGLLRGHVGMDALGLSTVLLVSPPAELSPEDLEDLAGVA